MLIQIAIFKCHARKEAGASQPELPVASARGEEQLYEPIDENTGPTYMELGSGGKGRNAFQLTRNEAYATNK